MVYKNVELKPVRVISMIISDVSFSYIINTALTSIMNYEKEREDKICSLNMVIKQKNAKMQLTVLSQKSQCLHSPRNSITFPLQYQY